MTKKPKIRLKNIDFIYIIFATEIRINILSKSSEKPFKRTTNL